MDYLKGKKYLCMRLLEVGTIERDSSWYKKRK
jgi:hypothetical protein